MAHLVYGLDVGSFSVKLAVIEAGFRQSKLVGLIEEPIPAGDAPLGERRGEALRAVAARVSPEATICAALPGELLSIRAFDLPFSDARKIAQVVGYELEGQIVRALEDVVFDHLVVPAPAGGSTVVAAAARRDDVGACLASLQAQGLDPRSLLAAPLAYRGALPREGGPPDPSAPPPTQGLVDLGHQRTNVCFLRNGSPVFARTILRGGLHLTEALARAFRCGFEQAEQGKLAEGFVASPGRPAPAGLPARIDGALREALVPLVRELRQTLAPARGEMEALFLTGGTARLAGLPEFLAGELGLPVSVLPAQSGEESGAAPSPFTLAIALARAGARGKNEIDLRRGPFVYRARVSLLRGKGLHVAGLAAALVAAAAVDGSAAMSRLKKERAELDAQLESVTRDLFGEPRADARAVALLLRRGFKEDMAPLPKATAFDLLDQISRRVPPADKIKLDVTELDIRPKKTLIKGTVDSAAAVDDLAGKLKEIDCFDDIAKGAITEVSDGSKQFTLTITSRCP